MAQKRPNRDCVTDLGTWGQNTLRMFRGEEIAINLIANLGWQRKKGERMSVGLVHPWMRKCVEPVLLQVLKIA